MLAVCLLCCVLGVMSELAGIDSEVVRERCRELQRAGFPSWDPDSLCGCDLIGKEHCCSHKDFCVVPRRDRHDKYRGITVSTFPLSPVLYEGKRALAAEVRIVHNLSKWVGSARPTIEGLSYSRSTELKKGETLEVVVPLPTEWDGESCKLHWTLRHNGEFIDCDGDIDSFLVSWNGCTHRTTSRAQPIVLKVELYGKTTEVELVYDKVQPFPQQFSVQGFKYLPRAVKEEIVALMEASYSSSRISALPREVVLIICEHITSGR